MLLLFALTAGLGNTWAEEVKVYTLTPAKGSNSSYTGNCDITIDEVTWNLAGNSQQIPWRIGGKSITNTDRELYSKTPISDNISKIEVTHGAASSITVNSWTVIVSKNADFSDPVSTLTPTFAANNTTTIERPVGKDWSNCYFKFVYNVTVSGSSNKFIEFSKAEFYYKESIAITSISLPASASVGAGGAVTLTPTVVPSDYTETVDWESDATGVATVSDAGVVTGVAAGTAHIKAKAHDNSSIYAECTVTVTAPIAVTGVSLKSSTTIELGKTETLVPTLSPADATNKNVIWVSDDDTKVTVDDDGVITGVALTGDSPVIVTVVTDDGDFEAECAVTVIPKNTDVNLTSPISITEWPSLEYGDGTATEYEVDGIFFTATQCMKNSGLQFRKNEGVLASPLIKSASGYTVIVTTNDAGTGTLTLQIGSETPVSIESGSNTAYYATTSSTSAAFTLTNSSSKACNIASIAIVPPVSVTVSDAGYATFASDYALDFTDSSIKAYIAKGKADYSGVTFEQVSKVPANTGVLLYCDGGATENIPVLTTTPDATTGNVFVRGKGAAVASVDAGDANLHNYILNKVGGVVGFYKAAGRTVATNRAYIQIDESTAYSIKEFISLPGYDEDGADGIGAVRGEGAVADGPVFDLQGRRVQNPDKGLYIVNGKKVMY